MVLETQRLEGGELIAYDQRSQPIAEMAVQLATVVTHNREGDPTVRKTLTIRAQCEGETCPFRRLIDGIGDYHGRFTYKCNGWTWEGEGKMTLMRGAFRCASNCTAVFDVV